MIENSFTSPGWKWDSKPCLEQGLVFDCFTDSFVFFSFLFSLILNKFYFQIKKANFLAIDKPLSFSQKIPSQLHNHFLASSFMVLSLEIARKWLGCGKHGWGSEQPVQTYCKLNRAIWKHSIFLNQYWECQKVHKEHDHLLNHLDRILIPLWAW